HHANWNQRPHSGTAEGCDYLRTLGRRAAVAYLVGRAVICTGTVPEDSPLHLVPRLRSVLPIYSRTNSPLCNFESIPRIGPEHSISGQTATVAVLETCLKLDHAVPASLVVRIHIATIRSCGRSVRHIGS